MRSLGLLITLLLSATVLRAQVITGKVIDAESSKPIAGASIYLNGTSTGATSANDGSFMLNTAETNIPLIISCIGYSSQTLTGYAGKNLNISLKPKHSELREVVIGFDAMRREDEMEIF